MPCVNSKACNTSYLLLQSLLTAVQVVASFFGVGAPEALLVGAVALIVFGPKGLVEVRLHPPLQLSRL
jgi:hypothetical protein